MDLWDKILWLFLGGFPGFVLGYIVRDLRTIRSKVEELDRSDWQRNEDGLMARLYIREIGMLFVVLLTACSAFLTGRLMVEYKHALDCLTSYNVHQQRALIQRDDAVDRNTQSEIKLWTQYGQLYAQAKKDPSKIPAAQEKLDQAIAAHRSALVATQASRNAHPYADPNVLRGCQKEN